MYGALWEEKSVTAPTLNEFLDNITTRSFSSADVFMMNLMATLTNPPQKKAVTALQIFDKKRL